MKYCTSWWMGICNCAYAFSSRQIPHCYLNIKTIKLTCTAVIYYKLYNNVTSVCIFIGCWPWSIKGHTWRQIHVRSRQQTHFSLFMPQKFFNKPFDFLLYKTKLHFSVHPSSHFFFIIHFLSIESILLFLMLFC